MEKAIAHIAISTKKAKIIGHETVQANSQAKNAKVATESA